MTKKNLEVIVICYDLMKVSGIFTDGDLRRICNMGIDFYHTKISDVMTIKGICIQPNVLVVDALKLMKKYHITTLLVTYRDQLLRVIHIHNILNISIF